MFEYHMKVIGVAALIVVMSAVTSHAQSSQSSQDTQDTLSNKWSKSIALDLTSTQTSYSDSWVGGEAGSFTWVSNLNSWAEKRISSKFNFKSTLKISYGQTMTQDRETKNWSKPSKSTDLVDWENVGRLILGGAVDPYLAFRLESQIVDASVSAKKRNLNPMKLTESVGFAKVLVAQERNKIVSRFGFALRQIISREIVDSVLYTTATNTLTDGGIESVSDVNWSFNEKLTYTGKLTLYKALFFSGKDAVAGTPSEDDWKAIDINWENIITASISKVIAVNFYTQFLYDKQVSLRGRFKQTMGIGFALKIS
ncbi:MAG: hypothetical protein IIB00_02830 [candidate division Zixibacteria bacterium]|nr:hypothetical protein [candidate division Zixibacteria bacterium]